MIEHLRVPISVPYSNYVPGPYSAPFVRYSQILVENRRFNLPHLSVSPVWGDPVGSSLRSLAQKTRKIALSYGIKNIAGRFFGLVTKQACDRRTDGQSDGQNYDSQDRASIAATRGKNRQSSIHSGTTLVSITMSSTYGRLHEFSTTIDLHNVDWDSDGA